MKIRITVKSPDGTQTEITADKKSQEIQTQPGAEYILENINGAPEEVPASEVVENDLHLMFNDGSEVILKDYFEEETDPRFLTFIWDNWYFQGLDTEFAANAVTTGFAAEGAMTLMRHSSVEFMDFGGSLNDLLASLAASGPRQMSGSMNLQPVGEDDTFSVTEKGISILDVLANDMDMDGALTVVAINGDESGSVDLGPGSTLSINPDGTISFSPNGAYTDLDEGESVTETFTYTISDGQGGTTTSTVTITINGEDDPMVVVDDAAEVAAISKIMIDVVANDSDPDASDVITVASLTQPGRGSAALVGGQIEYDPELDFLFLNEGETATETFTYTATTPDGDTDIATVTVTIVGVDDLLIADPDFPEVPADAPSVIDVLANDTDPDF